MSVGSNWQALRHKTLPALQSGSVDAPETTISSLRGSNRQSELWKISVGQVLETGRFVFR